MVNLILDYDGTLHESIKIYAPAFRKAQDYLVSNNLAPKREFSDEEISQWLGYTPTEMWSLFAPGLPNDLMKICSKIIGEELLSLTAQGKAALFPHAEEVLSELKRMGHNLLFLSNCKLSYMDAHRKHFELDRFFDAFYCSDEFDSAPKYEIFRQIKDRWPGDFAVIGDRYHDIEVAEQNGIKSIGCLYGYGKPDELKGADFLAEDIEAIVPLVRDNMR